MTVDLLLNIGLLFIAPTLLFTLVAGNIGYVLSHVFALSGFLLLRRDRPDWPRPLRHGPIWIVIAWICLVVNVIGTIFGVIWIHYTGYLYKVTDSTLGYDLKYYQAAAIITGLLVLVVGVVGYIVGQRQHGKKFSWRDTSEEQPSPEVYALMAAPEPPAPASPATDRKTRGVSVLRRGHALRSGRAHRGGQIRTDDLVLPKHVRYQATLRPAAAECTRQLPARDATNAHVASSASANEIPRPIGPPIADAERHRRAERRARARTAARGSAGRRRPSG